MLEKVEETNPLTFSDPLTVKLRSEDAKVHVKVAAVSLSEYVPLFQNLKEPDQVWYCANPLEVKPVLTLISRQAFEAIVTKQRGKPFRYSDNIWITPDVRGELERKYPALLRYNVDHTKTIDKFYFGDMGQYGIGVFARVLLQPGESVCFSGGALARKNDNSGEVSQHAQSFSIDRNHYAVATHEIGGMGGFMQCLGPNNKMMGNFARANICYEDAAIGSVFDSENCRVGGASVIHYRVSGVINAGDAVGPYYANTEYLENLNKHGIQLALFDRLGFAKKTLPYWESVFLLTIQEQAKTLQGLLTEVCDARDAREEATLQKLVITLSIHFAMSSRAVFSLLTHDELALIKKLQEILSPYSQNLIDCYQANDPLLTGSMTEQEYTQKKNKVLSPNSAGRAIIAGDYGKPVLFPQAAPDKKQGEHFRALGLFHYSQKQFPLSVRFMLDALNGLKNKKSVAAGSYHWNLGNAYRQLGQYEDALRHLMIVEEIQRNNPSEAVIQKQGLVGIQQRIADVQRDKEKAVAKEQAVTEVCGADRLMAGV